MKLNKPRRKHYHPEDYADRLNQLTSLLNQVPTLTPDRNAWDIEGDFAKAGTIRFVDARLMHRFDPFEGFDCRTIKLVNLGKPAVRMNFSMTHRYMLIKDAELTTYDKQDRIQAYIDTAIAKLEEIQNTLAIKTGLALSRAKQTRDEYRQQIQDWRLIVQNLAVYEICVSNYSRQYYYLTINYKYWDEAAEEYKNDPVHLLNNQRDNLGNITQYRQNIVFVDTQEILREHPYQNKTIEKYLARFDTVTQLTLKRDQIYARPLSEIDQLPVFSRQIYADKPEREVLPHYEEKTRKSRKRPRPTPLFDPNPDERPTEG